MGLFKSRNSRALALIAAMFASCFAVGGVVLLITGGETAGTATMTSQLALVRGIAHDLSEAVDTEEAATDDYALSWSPAALKRYKDAIASEDAQYVQMAGLATDLPDVAAAVAALQVESRHWRLTAASPAIEAVDREDRSAIDTYAAQSAGDHDAIEGADARLEYELAQADASLAARQARVGVEVGAGTTIAFFVLILSFGVALLVVRRFGVALEVDAHHASILNRFTEVTSFAVDDHEVAVSNLVALERLVQPDAAVTHILNRSLDRADPEASTGDAVVAVLPLRALDRCAGVLRGTMYVTDDLSDALSVHCPIYPATVGTLACIPLASGEPVGAVHLYWARPNALPLERRSDISRITEHAAMAIGNRRLLAALHGQANTDPRTGLANSRAFDVELEAALAARTGSETVSVLMLDIDQFKVFNDHHGHPAGDEALRAFARVLQSCMREGDLAARYGGEEFAVLLPGTGSTDVAAIAERIRQRTESQIITIGPGVTDHITVSIGTAMAPLHGVDRVTLLRLADEALYQAKDDGRNRVVAMAERRAAGRVTPTSTTPAPAPRLAIAASDA